MTTPDSIDQVTDRWLSQIVGEPVSISGVMRIGEGYGLASDVYRVSLDGFKADSVAVKLWPVDSNARDTEVHFYNELAPSMVGDVPKHFHAEADDERGVLVLEDLRGRQGDVLVPEKTDNLALIVEALGRIHGRWWDSSELKAKHWLENTKTTRPSEWFASRRELFLERFDVPRSSVAGDLLQRASSVFSTASETLGHLPVTLAHADHHLDNILFVDGRPLLLDWAGCRRGPGLPDLVAVVFGMGGAGHADFLMDVYRDSLGRAGVEFGPEALDSAMGNAVLWSYVYWTLGTAMWIPVDKRSAKMQDRHIDDAIRMVETWATRDPELFDQALA